VAAKAQKEENAMKAAEKRAMEEKEATA